METDVTATPAYRAAETYERFFVAGMFRYWTPLLLQRARPQPGERALDVACGTGVVARSIVPLVKPGGQVVGLDINPAMLAVACRQFSDHCDEIDWREGEAEDLPFSAGEFDLVTCQQGFQFFKDKPRAAAEMHRVLRSGGRAVVEVWQPLAQNAFFEHLFDAISHHTGLPTASIATPYAFGDPTALREVLQGAGFRRVEVEQVTQEARFPDPAQFVRLTIRSAAAVIPTVSAAGWGLADGAAGRDQRGNRRRSGAIYPRRPARRADRREYRDGGALNAEGAKHALRAFASPSARSRYLLLFISATSLSISSAV